MPLFDPQTVPITGNPFIDLSNRLLVSEANKLEGLLMDADEERETAARLAALLARQKAHVALEKSLLAEAWKRRYAHRFKLFEALMAQMEVISAQYPLRPSVAGLTSLLELWLFEQLQNSPFRSGGLCREPTKKRRHLAFVDKPAKKLSRQQMWRNVHERQAKIAHLPDRRAKGGVSHSRSYP
jgi:hypothetical protein